MRSRWALPREQAALQSLWKLCFGDDEEVTDCFFALFPPKLHTRVMDHDGRIAAMASWLPVTLHLDGRIIPGAYIYAVATHPDFRGKGLCRSLMEELEASLRLQGMEFAALCPAEDSLYRFYGAMGYKTAFYRSCRMMKPGDNKTVLTQVSSAAYGTLRESCLSLSHCEWNQAALGYLAATGVRFYRFSSGGCGAVQPGPEGRIRVLEVISQDVSSAVAALCFASGAQQAEVAQPGGEQPHGMLKWLKNGQKVDSAYLGFAFD